MKANLNAVPQIDATREQEVERKRLRENCREFESVMVSYLMKSMRDTVMKAEEPENDRELYEEMLSGQISKEIGKNSGLGIGDMLYSKLEPLLKNKHSNLANKNQADLSLPENLPEVILLKTKNPMTDH